MAENETASRRGPVLVELMGLAGAGKSTVFDDLVQRRPWIEPRPVLRRREHAAVAVRHTVSVIATLASRGALRRVASPQDVKLMTYVQAIPEVLDRDEDADERTIVFDQGPVFLLTRPRMRDERLDEWWNEMFDAWASRLDVVVWLDAPDDVLLERINVRPKWHALKGRESTGACEVLTEARATYEDALARLASRADGPLILPFDTSREPADDIVDAVLTVLETIRGDGRGRRRGGRPPSGAEGGAAERASSDVRGQAASL